MSEDPKILGKPVMMYHRGKRILERWTVISYAPTTRHGRSDWRIRLSGTDGRRFDMSLGQLAERARQGDVSGCQGWLRELGFAFGASPRLVRARSAWEAGPQEYWLMSGQKVVLGKNRTARPYRPVEAP